jgi:hypothetical protein
MLFRTPMPATLMARILMPGTLIQQPITNKKRPNRPVQLIIMIYGSISILIFPGSLHMI